MRIQHHFVQGSPEWHQFRLEPHYFGASEAAAMLGLSKKVTRSELLRAKHTGMAREFSDWLQKNVLDRGHEVEALARPIVERMLGVDLYPAMYSDGKMSASCDGIDMLEEVVAEIKQWAEDLAASVRAGLVPEHHMPQCQQQLMVTGAKKGAFVVSDGTEQGTLYTWVYPDPVWFERLRSGWAQFERDLAAYVLPDVAEPEPVGRAPETLPALRIEVSGHVVSSNLAEIKATALAEIRSVNRDLRTDQDFADAERSVKWCGDVETRLAAAKEHALSQTSSIDALFRTINDISTEARSVRLDLEKLVARRKVEIKEHAIVRARKALDEHIARLNAEIAPMRILPVAADFAGAIKGLKTMTSVQDKLDGALAAAKIAADAAAAGVRANLKTFQELAAGYEYLFSDLGSLVHETNADHFRAMLEARIGSHKAAAARRAAADTPEARAMAQAARRQAAEEPATLKLGTICQRLGFALSSAFIADALGIKHARTQGPSILYRDGDLERICRALQLHVGKVCDEYAAKESA